MIVAEAMPAQNNSVKPINLLKFPFDPVLAMTVTRFIALHQEGIYVLSADADGP